jgi:signal peptidase I
MATNPTTDKLTDLDAATETETKPSAFSRLLNRNGHEKNAPPPAPVKGPVKSVAREYFESAVVTVVMALFGMTFIVQAVKVPTGSMQNTIKIGDHLLVNKFIFAPGKSLPFLPQREIRRGDIIVFKYPGNSRNPQGDDRDDNRPYLTNYVKRVIGLPGDRISINNQDVIVNGAVLPEYRIPAEEVSQKAPLKEAENVPPRKPEEAYNVYYGSDREPIDPDQQPYSGLQEFVVPDNSYFVLGDNRDNSQDSRFWGFVPRDLVIGRAMFVYWSYDESAEPTGYGIFVDFFKNTRWDRTGTLVK